MAAERGPTAKPQQTGNSQANKLARIAWSVLRHEKMFDAPHHKAIAI